MIKVGIFVIVGLILGFFFVANAAIVLASEKIPQQEEGNQEQMIIKRPLATSINATGGDINTQININNDSAKPTPTPSPITYNNQSLKPLNTSPISSSISKPTQPPVISQENASSETGRVNSFSAAPTNQPQNFSGQEPVSEISNVSSLANDQSNYYEEFNLPRNTAVFLLLIAVSFFLLGLGLMKPDIWSSNDKLNSFDKTHRANYPTV